MADSILDNLASQLSAYSQDLVLNGIKTYLQKNYAAEGKNERYLVGIVRQLAKRNGDGFKRPVSTLAAKTEGQLAIERAMREMEEERRQ